jgi:uncharacterized membrane protein
MRFAVYEAIVAPAALALAALEARRAFGGLRALAEIAALVAYGFGLEWTAIAVFGSHRYAEGWRVAPLGVPLAVASVWAALIVSSLGIAGRLGVATPAGRAAAAALLGITLDLLMEPVAVRAGLWQWTVPGHWLGIPIGNYVGWAVIVGVYAFGAERWGGDDDRLGDRVARRLALGIAAIASLMAIGLAWRAVGAERLFSREGGWVVWAALLLAAAGLGLRRLKPFEGPTPAGRLAAGGARLSEGVFVLVAAPFAADALRLRTADLTVVAAGTCLVLFVVLPDALPARLIDRWRRDARAALGAVDGLMRVLMKPRNGEAWTDADRAFLRDALRAAARWTPALFLFMLPGSLLLLPIYAAALDRRRGRRRPDAAELTGDRDTARRTSRDGAPESQRGSAHAGRLPDSAPGPSRPRPRRAARTSE